jgi:hypothetical protein
MVLVTDPGLLSRLNELESNEVKPPEVMEFSPSEVTDPSTVDRLKLLGNEKTGRQLNSSFSATAGLNPDTEAEVQNFSKKLGVPDSTIRPNLEKAKDIDSLNSLNPVTHPTTSNYLITKSNISRDDVPQLKRLEDTTKIAPELTLTRLVHAAKRSLLQNVSSKAQFGLLLSEPDRVTLDTEFDVPDILGLRREERFLDPEATPDGKYEKDILNAIIDWARVEEPEPLEGFAGYVEDVVGGVFSSVPELALSAVRVVGPAIMAASAFATIAGGKYAELKSEGIPGPIARDAALTSAAWQTPIEFASTIFQLKLFKGLFTGNKGFIRTLVGSSLSEGAEEYAQKFPDEYANISARNPGLTTEEKLGIFVENFTEIAGRAIYPGLVGLGAGFFMTGSVKVASAPREISEYVRDKRTATAVKDRLEKVNEAVHETKTQQRSPESIVEFLQTSGLTEEVYIEPEAAQEMFQSATPKMREVLDKIGMSLEEIEQHRKNGLPIKASSYELMTKLSPEEFKLISPNLALLPASPTFAEMDKFDIKTKMDIIEKEIQADEKLVKQEVTVHKDRIKTQLKDVGYKVKDAEAVLSLVDRFSSTQSEQTEFLGKLNFKKGEAPIRTPEGFLDIKEGKLKKVLKKVGLVKEPPRGSLVVADDQYFIKVFENADKSTVLHELGHVFLLEMEGLNTSGKATEQHKLDFQVIKDWLGNLLKGRHSPDPRTAICF